MTISSTYSIDESAQPHDALLSEDLTDAWILKGNARDGYRIESVAEDGDYSVLIIQGSEIDAKLLVALHNAGPALVEAAEENDRLKKRIATLREHFERIKALEEIYGILTRDEAIEAVDLAVDAIAADNKER